MFGLFHKKSQKTKLFIDAQPIAVPNISGVGHLLVNTISALISLPSFTDSYEIILIASPEKIRFLHQWNFKDVTIKPFPIKSRYINGLVLKGVSPPLDAYFGKGIYLFANFTTWPLSVSKSITYIHDLSFERFSEYTRPEVYKSLHKNVPKWLKRTSKVVTISEFSAKEISDFYNYNIEDISVLHCGVDTTKFYKRTEADTTKILQKYGLPERYTVFIGSLEPRKNLENLIASYEKLDQELAVKFPLVLVGGDGWKNDGIKAAIARCNKDHKKIIIPESYVSDDDLPYIYSGAEALLFVPHYEGFGLPPIQAMACGTPCLVSDVASLPEVCGDAALYCDPNSIDAISQNITRILTEESIRKDLKVKGLNQIRKFTWSASALQLRTLVDELSATIK